MKKTPESKVCYNELIDISHVPELTEVTVTNEGVILGGALSLSKVMTVLEELIAEGAGNAHFLCPNIDETLTYLTNKTSVLSFSRSIKKTFKCVLSADINNDPYLPHFRIRNQELLDNPECLKYSWNCPN